MIFAQRSAVFFSEIAKYKSGVTEYQEQTSGDGIEFPALRERIADAGFQQISNYADQNVKNEHFEQA